MPDIQTKIDELTAALKKQLANNEPIDSYRIQELIELRRNRDKASPLWHERREETMKKHTEEWSAKRPALKTEQTTLNTILLAEIAEQEELYDVAARSWVEKEACPWEDSRAAEIAAGLLILFSEIC